MTCEIPFNHTAKQGMLQRDFAYGFGLRETVTNLLASIFSFLIITSGWNLMWGKQALTQLGWVNTVTCSHSFPRQAAASSAALGSQGAVQALPKGAAEWNTPPRSLSLSINYRGSPRKLYPQLNLVIVNPLPTSEYVPYQADLAAGND